MLIPQVKHLVTQHCWCRYFDWAWNYYLLVSRIPIVPPAKPHQMKLFISNNQIASVPKINAPNAQPRARQNIRIPTIWLVLITDYLSLLSIFDSLYLQLASYQSESDSDQGPYESTFSRSSHFACVFEQLVISVVAITNESAKDKALIRIVTISILPITLS